MLLKIQFFLSLIEDVDNKVRIEYQCYIDDNDDDERVICVS
jgi:hypothetical protein